MRQSIGLAVVVALLSVPAISLADEEASTATPAAAAPAAATTPAAADGDNKKLALGGDLQFVIPVGDLADASGPQIGPLLRFGYFATPALEITGRVGYLYGLSKDTSGIKTSMSNIPVWAGVRYYFMQPGAGLYGAGEVGLNYLTAKVEGEVFGVKMDASNSEARFGFNVGAGYVISKELPIDIRAQFMHHNLIGTEDGEKAMLGIGISAGYTASF